MIIDPLYDATCLLDGISISQINEFVKYNGGRKGFDGKTTEDVNNEIQKPITLSKKVSYCEYLKENNASSIKKANVFISHAWKYKFLDLVDAINKHFKGETDTIVWCDVFSINQHKLNSIDIFKSIKNAIKEIGRAVVILSPWNNAIPFTRAWCLWEIYCAIDLLDEDKLQIAMSSKEKEAFVNGLTEKTVEYLQLLANVHVEKSEAREKADKDRIFAEVRAMDGGFNKVNELICSKIRTLVVKIFKDAIDSETELTKALVNRKRAYGIIVQRTENYTEAMAIFEECLEEYSQLNDYSSIPGVYNHLGLVYNDAGKYVEARECYEKALEIQKEHHLHEDDKLVAKVYHDMGMVYKNETKYVQALEYYEKALNLEIKIHGEVHSSTAKTYNNMGVVYRKQKNYDQALTYFEKALNIKKETLTEGHADFAGTYTGMGLVYKEQYKYDQALEHFNKALVVHSNSVGKDATKYKEVNDLIDEVAKRKRKWCTDNQEC
jgi:tetratricopeptide (TPR) repeat protein